MKQFRQGDVFIERIEELPKEIEEIALDDGRVVLAYGEVTGHAHAIAGTTAKLYRGTPAKADALVKFLRILKPTSLKHEEHGPIELAPGNYRVIQQREYSPEEIRRVAD